MGYRVSPDTVLIGQQFNLFIKVLAPTGVRFEFPTGPDTTTQNGVRPIELRGEKLVSMLGDTAVALYHLVAWDIGTQPLRIPDVRVTFEGQERRPPLGGASAPPWTQRTSSTGRRRSTFGRSRRRASWDT